MRQPKMGPIGDALDEYFARSGIKKRIDQSQIVNDWKDLVGPRVSSVCSPNAVDTSGTLWVRVKSAAWMQELQMMSPTIIQELARRGRRIKRIRWIAGSVDAVEEPRRRYGRPNNQ